MAVSWSFSFFSRRPAEALFRSKVFRLLRLEEFPGVAETVFDNQRLVGVAFVLSRVVVGVGQFMGGPENALDDLAGLDGVGVLGFGAIDEGLKIDAVGDETLLRGGHV